jgi:hypothetical protein
MAKIFICYRREDSGGDARGIADRIKRNLGADVFMDVTAIAPGANFVKVLHNAVAKCEVLLAVIGPNWLDARDERGNRRLDNPDDLVRIEIAAALQRDIPVVPVLLNGARIPAANYLPKELADLSFRNGIDVRHSSFDGDVERLINWLQQELNVDAHPSVTQRRKLSHGTLRKVAILLGGALVLFGGVGLGSWWMVARSLQENQQSIETQPPNFPAFAAINLEGKWVVTLGGATGTQITIAKAPRGGYSAVFPLLGNVRITESDLSGSNVKVSGSSFTCFFNVYDRRPTETEWVLYAGSAPCFEISRLKKA